MKKTAFILTITFFSLSVSAECQYSGYYVKFGMTTTDGKYNVGYVFVSSCHLNTNMLNNTEDLKRAFVPYDDIDTLTYFQNRMIYQYQSFYGYEDSEPWEKQTHIFYLLNKATIPLKDIKWIEVFELIRESSYIFISSELQLSDSRWMRQEPIKNALFTSNWGFICSHQLFVHANSEKVDSVIKQLELKYKELYTMKDEDIYENVSEIHIEIMKIIEKLKGEKVIVVSECTD
jgi:hypothetical protein